MAKGFINLNRFKHGKAIKQSSKRKANLQSNRRVRDKERRRRPAPAPPLSGEGREGL